MAGPIVGSHLRSNRRLIFFPPTELFKRYGYGLDILLARIAHEPKKCAGINSTGQEGAYRNVGDEMVPDTVEKRFSGVGLQVVMVGGQRCGFRLAVRVCDGEILMCLPGPHPVDPYGGACRHSADFLVGRKRLGNAAEQVKSNPTGWLRVAGDLATASKALTCDAKRSVQPSSA